MRNLFLPLCLYNGWRVQGKKEKRHGDEFVRKGRTHLKGAWREMTEREGCFVPNACSSHRRAQLRFSCAAKCGSARESCHGSTEAQFESLGAARTAERVEREDSNERERGEGGKKMQFAGRSLETETE